MRTSCSENQQEKLLFPGFIQPHGVMLYADSNNIIRYISENVSIIGLNDPYAMLEKSLDAYLNPMENRLLCQNCDENSPQYLCHARVHAGKSFDMSLYPGETGHLIEWEPNRHISDISSYLPQRSTNLHETYSWVLEKLMQISGYERVFIYRFEDDASGTVVAERNSTKYNNILGLRYATSDIPEEVRNLFLQNRLRYIENVVDDSVKVLSKESYPLNMKDSQLRAVPDCHRLYLRNIGVVTSCSCAVMIQGKLWGLLGLQSTKAQTLGPSQRRSIAKISQGFSLFLTNREAKECMKFFDRYRYQIKALGTLNAKLERFPEEVIQFFRDHFDCDGVAYSSDGHWVKWGQTPVNDILLELSQCLWNRQPYGHIQTDCAQATFPDVYRKVYPFCGISATWVKKQSGDLKTFFWFKKEALQTVIWGSRDRQIVDESPSPRASFHRWQEKMSGHSLTWSHRSLYLLQAIKAELLASMFPPPKTSKTFGLSPSSPSII